MNECRMIGTWISPNASSTLEVPLTGSVGAP